MPIATTLGRLMSYHERLPLVKSHEPLITCSRRITRLSETIISRLPPCLCPPNLTYLEQLEWLHSIRSFPSCSHMVLWSCSLASLRDKLDMLYRRYHKVMTIKPGKKVTHFEVIKSCNPLNTWSSGSLEKLKTLNLNNYNTYGHWSCVKSFTKSIDFTDFMTLLTPLQILHTYKRRYLSILELKKRYSEFRKHYKVNKKCY